MSIDDDVLIAAKERAKAQGRTAGQVLSELARAGLLGARDTQEDGTEEFMGFRPLPRRGGIVTNDLIDRLRAEEDV